MSDENKDQNQIQDDKDKQGDDKKPKKVQFNEEQTVAVNRLFNQAFGEGAAAAERKLQETLAAEKAAREAAEKKLADLEAAKATQQGDDKDQKDQTPQVPKEIAEQLKRMEAQQAELKALFDGVKAERDTLQANLQKANEERRKSRKKDKFIDAAKEAKVQFYDINEAYEIAEKDGLDYDPEKDRVLVKNLQTGAPRLNSEGEEMNAIDFVKEFSSKKKYLVIAPSQDGGTGSAEVRRHEESKAETVKSVEKMSPKEFEEYRQQILSKPRQ